MAEEPQDVKISPKAEEELASHFSEPSYNVSFTDGSETLFNLSDIVALVKEPEINENDEEEITYHAELISGLSVTLDESAYEDLKLAKHWNNENVTGEYKVSE